MSRGAAALGGACHLTSTAEALRAALAAVPPDRQDGGLLLAVSGGPDSLALLLAARELKAAGRLPGPLAVATVDHALRLESASEAEAVAHLSSALNLPHRTLRWDRAEPSSGNLSAEAREARYRLLGTEARRIGAAILATAHHLDDQIETHRLALARGANGSALAAMRPWRDLEPGLVLLRPLLSLRKADLVDLVRAAGHQGADDPTNRDPRYARARLRAAPPDAVEERVLLQAIALAQSLRACEDEAMADRLQALTKAGALSVSPLGEIELPAAAADPPLLSRAVTAAGGGAYPPARDALHRLVLRITGEAQGHATLGGARLAWRNGRLVISREYGRDGPPDLLWPPAEITACFDRRFDIEAPRQSVERIVPRGRWGGGASRHRTLPVAVDGAGTLVAAHPGLPLDAQRNAAALAVSCRVAWRLCADLARPAGTALTGRPQNAANHGEPVGKGVAYTYIRGQVEASCVEGRTVARAHFQDG